MARKTKSTKKIVVKKTHPRLKRRGWLVLRKRWIKLLSQLWILLKDTFRFWATKIDQRTISLGLILIGLMGVMGWANYWWTKNEQALDNQRAYLAQQLTVPIETDAPHPTRIFIRWFVDTPIVDGIVEGNNWTLSEKEAIYISQSARPGEGGNVIIYGHNTREVLGNIRALKGEERVVLTMDDGNTKEYQVKEMKEIKPEDVSVIQPTDYEVLTLYTCSGFADKNRFVVRAYPVE